MKTVAVYSTKGGVGKTTAAINLAWEASRECRVLLWDLDPQGASTYVLNVKPRVKGGVDYLVRGKTEMDAAIRSTAYKKLAVLPSDETYRDLDLVLDAAKKPAHRIAKVLESVAKDYDFVILDCPPGESRVAENALNAADLVVLPLVPSPLALRSLAQVNEIIADSDSPPKVFEFLARTARLPRPTYEFPRNQAGCHYCGETVECRKVGKVRRMAQTTKNKTTARSTGSVEKQAKKALARAAKSVQAAREAVAHSSAKLRKEAQALSKQTQKLATKQKKAAGKLAAATAIARTQSATIKNSKRPAVPTTPPARGTEPTLVELRRAAREQKIAGYSRLNKAALIARMSSGTDTD